MSALLALLLAGQAIPGAVIADPPRDAAHSARNEQLLVPSHGQGMNALILHASGAGPKPLVVLLHGLPGNERNLDLAQAIRRAGWSVLTFSYRGAFGSPGKFSIANAVADAAAATAFITTPEAAKRYGIDGARVVLAGHSMGGFAAAMRVAGEPKLAGLVLIDAWNVGADGADARAKRVDAAVIAKGFDDLGNLLVGADGASLAREVLAAPADWNLLSAAPRITMPVLVIGAQFGGERESDALAAALRNGGNARVTAATMATDHSFADHRIALAGAVVGWLQALPR